MQRDTSADVVDCLRSAVATLALDPGSSRTEIVSGVQPDLLNRAIETIVSQQAEIARLRQDSEILQSMCKKFGG
jgi:hypothetical protein